MCKSKNAESSSDSSQKASSTRLTPHEMSEILESARNFCAAIADHAPSILLHPEVEQEWKRLGECLAWLQR